MSGSGRTQSEKSAPFTLLVGQRWQEMFRQKLLRFNAPLNANAFYYIIRVS